MKQVLVFLFVLCFTNTFAQDIIVKKDFTTITAKVLEVGTNEVKYKNWSNQDGPTYTISIINIYQINYANGTKDDFSNIKQQQEENTRLQDSNLQQQMRTANLMRRDDLLASAHAWHVASEVWFWVSMIGTFASGYAVYDESNTTPAWIVVGSGIVVTIGGKLLLQSISDKKENAANWLSSNHLIKKNIELGNDTRLSAGLDLIKDRIRNDYSLGLGLNINF